MPYNGASNGSGSGGSGGGGSTIVVSEGPQNKKIRTGVQQPGENDVHMHARSTQQQNQQQALMNKSNDDLRRKRPETTRPNHILLFTIINPFYPITVDVLHKICNPHGQVLRIVIFKKNGVQAMVEFDSLDAATRARENLNGADIYAGCCTLKIDYAKPEKLNVYKNEPDTSWDYTLSTGMHFTGSEATAAPDLFVIWLAMPDSMLLLAISGDLDDNGFGNDNNGDERDCAIDGVETTIITTTPTCAILTPTSSTTITTKATATTTTTTPISSRYKSYNLNRSLKCLNISEAKAKVFEFCCMKLKLTN
ncbi:uncharacterized protein LOC115634596 isoform X15 [Scaptodrosophila lebanonensis]|uniref:Uncharacterized protein LOC115634596 isoform X15 n=1 Tax=Drosophila lebanonensis TaxID=7225 RepID=A0A6J2UJD7_DROLE|nr:uncharacterized protein LOC115634596 isoform X15 [Scaptodrosophila lebanonensis]